MYRIDMNYRDEKILEWITEHHAIQIKYDEIAEKYNCSHSTIKRLIKRFKTQGIIDIENLKRGGVIIHVKVNKWQEKLH